MTVSWSAGPHHGLVWPVPDGLGAAIVDGEVDGADVTSLWSALHGVADLWSFVETMWRVVGVGLAGMPPFAVILPGDDGVIVAARGPFLVRADDGETTRTFTGHDVSTWCEGHVPRPATIVAEMTGPASPGGPPPRPLTGGVVPVRSMRMEVAVAAAGTIPPPTGAPASAPPATSRHEDVGLGVPPAAAPGFSPRRSAPRRTTRRPGGPRLRRPRPARTSIPTLRPACHRRLPWTRRSLRRRPRRAGRDSPACGPARTGSPNHRTPLTRVPTPPPTHPPTPTSGRSSRVPTTTGSSR